MANPVESIPQLTTPPPPPPTTLEATARHYIISFTMHLVFDVRYYTCFKNDVFAWCIAGNLWSD